jgi:hypothetical protein
MNLERLEDHVRSLIGENQKVEAIKLVLEATGWGLKESKEYVDSLEATKRRRQRRRKRSEGRRESPVLQVGDSVMVKPGILDPDFGIEIDGWQGRISVIGVGQRDTIMIARDSVTLRHMPDSVIKQSIEQGLDWTQMGLKAHEIELTSPRDTEKDVSRAIDELSRKHAWDWLGEQGKRVGKILTGVDSNDEMSMLDAWEDHLAEHLSFPFEAEVSGYQERGPLQAGDRVKVHCIFDVDDLYGVIVRLRHGRRQYYLPLCELKVTDQHSPNYQLVGDYAVWFANLS